MTQASNYFVSVVAPLRNDADIAGPFVEEVVRLLKEAYQNYELVLVDDGSTDGTAELVTHLLARLECVRCLHLSRMFGDEIAILAGLDAVIGDVVVVIQPESDPPALIPKFVAEARRWNGIIYGVRTTKSTDPWLYLRGRAAFGGLLRRMLDIDLPSNATLFMALTRQTLNAVIQIKDKSHALRLFGTLVGFPHHYVEYAPTLRRARPRPRHVRDGIDRAIGLIVTNSTKPLRWVATMCVIASIVNLVYVAYVFVVAIFKEHVAEGWITTSLTHSFMFFFLFMILSVLSEYIARVLIETRDRPPYFIADEQSSSVMLPGEERRNVVSESV